MSYQTSGNQDGGAASTRGSGGDPFGDSDTGYSGSGTGASTDTTRRSGNDPMGDTDTGYRASSNGGGYDTTRRSGNDPMGDTDTGYSASNNGGTHDTTRRTGNDPMGDTDTGYSASGTGNTQKTSYQQGQDSVQRREAPNDVENKLGAMKENDDPEPAAQGNAGYDGEYDMGTGRTQAQEEGGIGPPPSLLPENDGPKKDSTTGKLLEKAGGMVGSQRMAEMGREKREQVGGADKY